jgi:1-deoxy-D-xylulose-5-phosphate reductoisomerase
LNTANETAVEAFLNEKISFTEIPRVVSKTMAEHKVLKGESVEEVISVSNWARQKSEEVIEALQIR